MVFFPGDDLLAAARPRGLPIGNLTSQFRANVYMNPFDHFVKRELRCEGYVRYVDDMLLFGDDKDVMWNWLDRMDLRSSSAPRRRTGAPARLRSPSSRVPPSQWACGLGAQG